MTNLIYFNVITKDNNNNNKIYNCKKVIFATTLKPLIKLTKNISTINYSKYIGTVPFIRIYCYYKKGYIDNLSHYTIVDSKLQKVIKINDNILMASYSDSANALYWGKIKQQSKDKQINIVSKYLEELNKDNGVIRFQDFFTVLNAISRNPSGRNLAWNFYRENWNFLVNK